MAEIIVDIHNECSQYFQPDAEEIESWIHFTLKYCEKVAEHIEVSLKIVGISEGTELNKQYRQKDGPTNILSFPLEPLFEGPFAHLGDLVICAPVLESEAKIQCKTLISHWAHIIIHGVLHLLGFDHITDQDAEIMENLEVAILEQFGYQNPYRETEAP